MIGLDTNVLVRYIAQDDEKQSSRAAQLIESCTSENPAFVSVVVLVELVWVLMGAYSVSRDEVAEVVDELLRSKEISISRPQLVAQALRAFRQGKADFADCLIGCDASLAGCEAIYSFDKAAVKSGLMESLI